MSKSQIVQLKSYSPLGYFSEVLRQPADFLLKTHQAHGDRFQFRLGTKNVVFFAHPDDIKKVLIEHKDTFLKSSTRSSFGDSVLTSEGKKWLELRKSAQGFFQFPNLDAMMPDIDRLILKALDALKKNQTEPLAVSQFFDSMVEILVLKLFFNKEEETGSENLGSKLYFLSDTVIKMGLFPRKPPKWFPLFGVKDFFSTLDDFNVQLMKKYDSSVAEKSACPFHSFASHLSKENPQRKEIENQLLSFFFAGFETTANALFWTFYLVNQNPEAKQRLMDEVQNFDIQNYSSYSALMNGLPWTKACLLEGMRIFPPVWFRTRTAAQTTDLSGATVEKNSLVWVSQYVTHRHPDFWSNPEQFDPSRFLDESKLHPYQYFPFSLGKNICQGRDMAMLEMMLIFARFFQNFDSELQMSSIKDLHPLARVSLRPNKEIFAGIKGRF